MYRNCEDTALRVSRVMNLTIAYRKVKMLLSDYWRSEDVPDARCDERGDDDVRNEGQGEQRAIPPLQFLVTQQDVG